MKWIECCKVGQFRVYVVYFRVKIHPVKEYDILYFKQMSHPTNESHVDFNTSNNKYPAISRSIKAHLMNNL